MVSSKKEVTLGLIQMSCAKDPKQNLEKAIQYISNLAGQGVQIVALSELFLSRYFCQTNDDRFFALAETIPGKTTARLGELAQEHNIVIIASLFEQDGKDYYNTACVLDADGKFLGKYRKLHIPDDLTNHYSEMYYFKPGNLGLPVFETRYAKIGLQVCWDQWFPEGARSLALKGAEIIFYPTAIGWAIRSDGQSPILAKIGERSRSLPDGPSSERTELDRAEYNAWQTVQRGHAISNTVFVAAINRTGQENHLTFWGGSFVSDPLGRVLKTASHDQEENLIVTCDLNRMDEVRNDWPFLTCRRSDSYSK